MDGARSNLRRRRPRRPPRLIDELGGSPNEVEKLKPDFVVEDVLIRNTDNFTPPVLGNLHLEARPRSRAVRDPPDTGLPDCPANPRMRARIAGDRGAAVVSIFAAVQPSRGTEII